MQSDVRHDVRPGVLREVRPDVRLALRRLGRARRHLVTEGLLAAALTCALPFVADGAASAPAEVQTLYLLALVVFVVAIVRLVTRLVAVLETPCPSCGEAFHGEGEALLWPRDLSRHGCAHCGIELRESAARAHRAT